MHTHMRHLLDILSRPDARRLAIWYGDGQRKTHVVVGHDDRETLCGRTLRGPWHTTTGLPASLRRPGYTHPAYCSHCARLAQEADV